MENGNGGWETLKSGTKAKLESVLERIGNAARRSGRTEKAVKLVAVTKYVDGTTGLEAALRSAGCVDFGENRVSRAMDKWHLFASRCGHAEPGGWAMPNPKEIHWHFIGSLQRNKVRRLLPYVSLLHSIDTPELFDAVRRIMDEENEKGAGTASCASAESSPVFPQSLPALLEVNISGEGNKHGFQPETFLDQAGPILENPGRIVPCGLMGMGGLASSPQEVRTQFATLRKLFEEVCRLHTGLAGFKEISMGMSGDFEIAVEEGATIVRIGSVLYPDGFWG